jgi:hypothetical protein
MAKISLVVRDGSRYPVDADTLVDAQGNNVADLNTGLPLIVLIAAGRSIVELISSAMRQKGRSSATGNGLPVHE